MYALLLAATMMSPAEFKMNLILPFAKEAEILVEMPAPEVGKRWKKLNAQQFQDNLPLISFMEYELKDIKVNGLHIKRLRFFLPKPKPAPITKDDV